MHSDVNVRLHLMALHIIAKMTGYVQEEEQWCLEERMPSMLRLLSLGRERFPLCVLLNGLMAVGVQGALLPGCTTTRPLALHCDCLARGANARVCTRCHS